MIQEDNVLPDSSVWQFLDRPHPANPLIRRGLPMALDLQPPVCDLLELRSSRDTVPGLGQGPSRGGWGRSGAGQRARTCHGRHFCLFPQPGSAGGTTATCGRHIRSRTPHGRSEGRGAQGGGGEGQTRLRYGRLCRALLRACTNYSAACTACGVFAGSQCNAKWSAGGRAGGRAGCRAGGDPHRAGKRGGLGLATGCGNHARATGGCAAEWSRPAPGCLPGQGTRFLNIRAAGSVAGDRVAAEDPATGAVFPPGGEAHGGTHVGGAPRTRSGRERACRTYRGDVSAATWPDGKARCGDRCAELAGTSASNRTNDEIPRRTGLRRAHRGEHPFRARHAGGGGLASGFLGQRRSLARGSNRVLCGRLDTTYRRQGSRRADRSCAGFGNRHGGWANRGIAPGFLGQRRSRARGRARPPAEPSGRVNTSCRHRGRANGSLASGFLGQRRSRARGCAREPSGRINTICRRQGSR